MTSAIAWVVVNGRHPARRGYAASLSLPSFVESVRMAGD